MSGGIDSALTAAIAVEALGAVNVIGVMMPSPYSSDGSIDDSVQLAENLGIQTIKIPIANIMQSFKSSLESTFSGMEEDITEENIQSRIRGTMLMAITNKYQSMPPQLYKISACVHYTQ